MEFFKKAMSKSSISVFMKGHDGEIWVNDTFVQTLKYSQEDIQDKFDKSAKIGLDFDFELEFMVNPEDVPYSLKKVVRLITKSGKNLHVELEKKIIDNNIIIFIHPKKIHNILLSDFFNEVRNALNGIIGFSNIIINQNDDEEEQTYLSNILRSSREIEHSLKTITGNKNMARKTDQVSSAESIDVSRDLDSDSDLESDSILDDQKVQVVYIEDNIVNVNLIKSLLAIFSYKIKFYHALDGKTGLELIRKHSPDIILLDLNLPDMNGYEIYDNVKKEGLLKGRDVIIISSEENTHRNKDPLDPKSEFYFTKPIDNYKFTKFIYKLANSSTNMNYD